MRININILDEDKNLEDGNLDKECKEQRSLIYLWRELLEEELVSIFVLPDLRIDN